MKNIIIAAAVILLVLSGISFWDYDIEPHMGEQTVFPTIIPVTIITFPNEKIIDGRYIIMDDISVACGSNNTGLVGCAYVSNGDMFIKKSEMDYVRDATGYDVFTHEYLHLRCEWEFLQIGIEYNWHYENGPGAVYMVGHDYWKSCGFFN